MSDIILGIPASYKARCLWDSGAMPSILCQSVVPLGTVVQPTSVKLSGVSNKPIDVVGEANISMVIGKVLFNQNFIIVPENAMTFPESSTVILGANFISHYGLSIDAGSWTINQNGNHIAEILPALIDTKLYTSVKSVAKAEPAGFRTANKSKNDSIPKRSSLSDPRCTCNSRPPPRSPSR